MVAFRSRDSFLFAFFISVLYQLDDSFVFAAGMIFSSAALADTPESLSAVLGSLSLVMNGFFSTCILAERYTTQDLIGTVIICGGSILALCFEQHGNDENNTDVEWLKKLFKARPFVIYSAIKGTSLGLLVLWETINTFALRLPPLHVTVYVLISAMMGSFSFTYSKCAGEQSVTHHYFLVLCLRLTLSNAKQFCS